MRSNAYFYFLDNTLIHISLFYSISRYTFRICFAREVLVSINNRDADIRYTPYVRFTMFLDGEHFVNSQEILLLMRRYRTRILCEGNYAEEHPIHELLQTLYRPSYRVYHSKSRDKYDVRYTELLLFTYITIRFVFNLWSALTAIIINTRILSPR